MCIILDNCKIGSFFGDPPHKDTDPIHNWLNQKSGKIVYSTGGKFDSEMSEKAKSRLLRLNQSGKAKLIPFSELVPHQNELGGVGCTKSNDIHILALAKASGARLLYTEDRDLISDFKNPNLISKPRGKVYSRAANKNLLTNYACKV